MYAAIGILIVVAVVLLAVYVSRKKDKTVGKDDKPRYTS